LARRCLRSEAPAKDRRQGCPAAWSQTQDLRVAQARRWGVVKEFKELIAAAEAKASGRSADAVIAEALEWRKDKELLDALAASAMDDEQEAVLKDTRGMIVDYLSGAKAEEIEHDHGPEKARVFVGIATGRRTPLNAHLDRWLKESSGKKHRTLGDYRRSVASLEAFSEKSGWPPTIETFSSRRAAGEYVSDLVDSGIHPRTANKYISGLSAYWRWLLRKGLASGDNPWRDQALPKPSAHQMDPKKRKREFTDDELSRLL
jgi:hypothetical protein